MNMINQDRIQARCGVVIREVVFLRALVDRLGIQRADLQYQKLYLGMQVADLLASQNLTLSYMKGMGLVHSMESNSPPGRKLMRCVNAVLAIARMRMLARKWNMVLSECQS